MSWRDMVREDCLLLYFSFMFVSSYFIYDFYMIKIWERERERGKAWGKMVPRSLEIRSSFGHQSLMSWRHKGKRRLSSLYFLLSIFFFIILYDFYMIKIWEREEECMESMLQGIGALWSFLDMIWLCPDVRRRREEGLLLGFSWERFFLI